MGRKQLWLNPSSNVGGGVAECPPLGFGLERGCANPAGSDMHSGGPGFTCNSCYRKWQQLRLEEPLHVRVPAVPFLMMVEALGRSLPGGMYMELPLRTTWKLQLAQNVATGAVIKLGCVTDAS
uniref:Uncharacterized protein n=1 Tax=Micrurus surinamensis TaxID=129470 RepID=A0A2D4PPL2_MICSU